MMNVIDIASPVRGRPGPSELLEPICWQTHAAAVFGKLSISVFVNGQYRVHRSACVSILALCRTAADAAALLRSRFFDGLPSSARWCVSLPPLGSDGFGITMQGSGAAQGVIINFGGLEETVSSLDVALNLAGRALIGECQLRVIRFGEQSRQWYLEPALGHPEQALLASGLGYTFSLFKKRTVTVRKNSVSSHLQENSADLEHSWPHAAAVL